MSYSTALCSRLSTDACTVHCTLTLQDTMLHALLMSTPCGPMQLEWRLSDEPVTDTTDPDHADPEFRKSVRAKIFLGYTSNLISAGVREQIK